MKRTLAALALALALGPVRATAQLSPYEIGPLQALDARIARGADPAADAAHAAKAGLFGMILMGVHPSEGSPIGVTCRTPFLAPPGVRARMVTSDAIPPPGTPEGDMRTRLMIYGRAYNLALIDQPDFPYADICRPGDPDPDWRTTGSLRALGEGARAPNRPIATLHEAARRGSVADLRRFMAVEPFDGLDDFGLTPLAWAVARDRPDIVGALLAAGADPMAGPRGLPYQTTPLLVAVSLGRVRELEMLLAKTPKPPNPWPSSYVEAAIQSNDAAVIRRLLADPHQPPRPGMYERARLGAPAANAVIDGLGSVAADNLLLTGAREADLELMKLAVRRGANPDAQDQSGNTPLGLALVGFKPEHEAAIDFLIAAKADVNKPGARGRFGVQPVWAALRRYSVLRRTPGAPADHALKSLIHAGARTDIPDVAGIPPVWTMLFSQRVVPDEIDSAPDPQVVALLVGAGMDVNAPFRAQRVLDWVQPRPEQDSPLAALLRRLGATHSGAVAEAPAAPR